MKAVINLIIYTLLTTSVLTAGEARLLINSTKIDDIGFDQYNTILAIESEEDIYGIQFNIIYDDALLHLSKNTILSKVSGVAIYSHIENGGIARVIMLGLPGQNRFIISKGNLSEFIEIQFTPHEGFRGVTTVLLSDISLAGKAGIEINVSKSSGSSFDVSFIKPKSNTLYNNFPNPFNSTTNIEYELAGSGKISLTIYDTKGLPVRELINEYQEKNYYSILWDGYGDNGYSVPTGRYLLIMATPVSLDTISMTLFK